MKKLVFLSTILFASLASAKYTSHMTCSEAHNLVQEHGAVVLYQNEHIYDRYVAHQGYCMREEVTHPAWIKTSDSDQCFVGYTCGQRNND